MKAAPGKELVKVLKRHGWELLRVQKSRNIVCQAGQCCEIVCADSPEQTAKSGLLKHLLRMAELSEEILVSQKAVSSFSSEHQF
jgi:predicted RNA binding protein YcfA (HicA-like mRNA interferase family)